MIDDPKARELIQRSRQALRPTIADRERIEAALRAQLGAAAFEAPESAAPPARHLGLKLASSAAMCVCVLGAVVFFARNTAAPTPPAPPSRAPAPAPQTPLTSPADEPSELAPAAPAPERETPAPQPKPPARKHDSLAQEVALLSQATRSLRSGDLAAALRKLDEHKRKYPQGMMREERRAARAQVLCSMGRVSEGNAELAGLPPRSPTAAQAEQVCSSAASKGQAPAR
jgi:hypothetical protein